MAKKIHQLGHLVQPCLRDNAELKSHDLYYNITRGVLSGGNWTMEHKRQCSCNFIKKDLGTGFFPVYFGNF